MIIQEKTVNLTPCQRNIIEHTVRCTTSPQRLVSRCKIILDLADGIPIKTIARNQGIDRKTIKKWRQRWLNSIEKLNIAESEDINDKEYKKLILGVFDDSIRSGAPATFTPEQIVQIVAIACEVIDDSDRPISRWTHNEIAQEAIKRNIVETISPSSVCRFLKRCRHKASQKPVLVEY